MPWLEVLEEGEMRRFPLAGGRTRIGGLGCEVVLASAPAGEVHIWDDPPRALYTGGGAPPVVDGTPMEEASLADGLIFLWGEARITYRHPTIGSVLEELPPEPPPSTVLAAPASSAGQPAAVVQETGRASDTGDRVGDRLRAGLLADQNLAAQPVLKKWRDAVIRREFDPDTCAREILDQPLSAADDPRLVERSGRLLRDLLMAPLTSGAKGASRRARTAARSGVAFLVSQFVAVCAYTLVLGLVFLLLRARWGWSPDGLLDGILDFLGHLVPDSVE
jgi:hypothetical protein